MLRVAAVAVAFLAVSCGVGQSEVSAEGNLATDESELRKNDPCATVRCAAGTHCKAKGQRAECVLDDQPVTTCASVLCIVGTVCEDAPSGPRCVTAPAGEPCGSTTCPSGQVCCNASCGICTPPGYSCIQLACQ
jgi:hypothetical protein